MKIAKQLRRGKRISEIETLYGKNAAGSSSKKGKSREMEEALPEPAIPELTAEFFESGFFRRFQVQRKISHHSLESHSLQNVGPILDPTDFVRRYLSYDNPCAENLGPEGALLCHVLYAWATSYGVDEHGNMDVPEGGITPLRDVNLLEPGKNELEREEQRNIRFAKMRVPITLILEEIDACGIMRKPSWDGARVLLLFLPLTEGESCSCGAYVVKLIWQAFQLQSSGWRCTNALYPRSSCFVRLMLSATMARQRALLEPTAARTRRPTMVET